MKVLTEEEITRVKRILCEAKKAYQDLSYDDMTLDNLKRLAEMAIDFMELCIEQAEYVKKMEQ